MSHLLKRILLLMLLLVAAAANTANADSDFVDVSDSVYPAQANDMFTGYYVGAYDVDGGSTYAWANNSLSVFNTTTQSLTADLGTPTDYSGYASFVRSDGSGGTYVGFTVTGNSDDRIYHVDASGTWDHVATMAGNFDLEIYNGNAYVSGLNSTDWSDPTSIWLLDESGNDNHDLIVEMGGLSAGLAFDNAGNAYYASYDGELYRWAADAIADAIGGTNLTYADGTKLADLEAGAYDVTVDDAGNVIFNGNGGTGSYIAMWDGTEGDGENYDYIGTGSGAYGDWFTMLDAEGDVTASGSLYQADSYYFGLAEVNPVPIPGAMVMMGTGLLTGAAYVRRRKVHA